MNITNGQIKLHRGRAVRASRLVMLLFSLFLIVLAGTSSVLAAGGSKRERFVMIGDSYSVVSQPLGVTRPWTQLVNNKLMADGSRNLLSTVYGGTAPGGVAGAGFYAPGKTFLMQLQRAKAKIEQAGGRTSSVTTILIGGGIGNDYRKSGGDLQKVLQAMEAFDTYAEKYFPRAVIRYAGFNWGLASSRQAYCKSWSAAYKEQCGKLGWIWLEGTDKALRGYENYYYFHTDLIHPKQSAQYLIANSILKALGLTASYSVPAPQTYSITYSLAGGTVSGNPKTYKQGFTKDITLKNPTRKGYTFLGWTGTGLSSRTKTVTLKARSLPKGNRTYTAHWALNTGFTDVTPSSAYYKAVLWGVKTSKVLTIPSGKLFSPAKSVTRGEILLWLYRLAGSPAVTRTTVFQDVKTTSVYAKAVSWAVQKKIASGTGKTTFSPEKVCTRGQVLTFLYRYNKTLKTDKTKKVTLVTKQFKDVAAAASYALPVTWAVKHGIASGTTATTFSPDKSCTRGQAMLYLYSYGLIK